MAVPLPSILEYLVPVTLGATFDQDPVRLAVRYLKHMYLVRPTTSKAVVSKASVVEPPMVSE